VGFHHDGGIVAEVVSVGLAVGHPGLTHDDDVVTETEGVWVEGDGAEVDVRVVAGCLTRRRAIEVPFWQLFYGLDWLVEGLQ